MKRVFSDAEREMFESTHKILGGPPEEALRSRLADGVFENEESRPSSHEPNWAIVDESFLRKAGADELDTLPGILGSGCTAGEPAPSARVMLSMRSSLFGRDDPGMDLQLRAGLHRLGRATADLDAASLKRVTRDMPAGWARCVRAAWFRLARLEECRVSAAGLREIVFHGGSR